MTQEEFFSRFTYDVAVDRIGGGGFGTVYKAYDNVLHRDAAIKVSEVKTTADGKKTFSLKDEFEALNHVPKHPNIANYEEFYSFKTPHGIFDYAVMQYYPDGNLSNAIKQGLSDEQKEEIAKQLLEGIGFLHQHKVVHRDLKPGNILIVRHGGKVIPLITDFGLSKAADTGDGSQFSNSFGGGTQRYSSPEQLKGEPLRFNTDLWSYGAIVYELFTGEQLFSPGSGAANSAQAEHEVYNKIIHGNVDSLTKMPERWRKVAERCMVVDPEKRAKSAEELKIVLNGYAEATEVEGVDKPIQPLTQSQSQSTTPITTKTLTNPTSLRPSEKKAPEPPKAETPSSGGKGKKGLWIGFAFALALVVGLLLFLLLKPAPVEVDEDTIAFNDCQTVDDYRQYLAGYRLNAKHHAEAKHFVDSVVADSIAKENEWLAEQARQRELRAYERCTNIKACDRYLEEYPDGVYVQDVLQKKADLEQQLSELKKNKKNRRNNEKLQIAMLLGEDVDQFEEDADNVDDEIVTDNTAEELALSKCTTIEGCEYYLRTFPDGEYVEQVKAKKAELEEQKEDEAFKKCTTIEACNKYLKNYPNGRYLEKVLDKKVELEAKLAQQAQQVQQTANTSTNSNSNSSQTFTVKGVTFVMKRVEGGTFQMGATQEQGSDADSDESPVHNVTLSTYYIGETEVTQALWKAVMGTTVRQQRDKANPSWPMRGEGDNYPMYYVSWNECQEFVRELNRLTGENFRLPTEAEWEYAARGGKKSNGCKYSGSHSIDNVAWYTSNSGSKTHPVKGKNPNELGLYDMSGNVWEWCSDWYGSYGSGSQTDPAGPSNGSYRVLRGGSWCNLARYCQVSFRNPGDPGGRGNRIGFRLALIQ